MIFKKALASIESELEYAKEIYFTHEEEDDESFDTGWWDGYRNGLLKGREKILEASQCEGNDETDAG